MQSQPRPSCNHRRLGQGHRRASHAHPSRLQPEAESESKLGLGASAAHTMISLGQSELGIPFGITIGITSRVQRQNQSLQQTKWPDPIHGVMSSTSATGARAAHRGMDTTGRPYQPYPLLPHYYAT